MTIPTLESFLARWEASGASERANYQLFLSELCDPVGGGASGALAARRGGQPLRVREGRDLRARQRLHEPWAHRPVPARVGHGRRKTAGWDEAMMKARGQAESYARALPASEGWPPFLLVVDVGFSIEVYADFSGLGKTYTPYPDPSSHRVFLPDLQNDTVRERLRIHLDGSCRTRSSPAFGASHARRRRHAGHFGAFARSVGARARGDLRIPDARHLHHVRRRREASAGRLVHALAGTHGGEPRGVLEDAGLAVEHHGPRRIQPRAGNRRVCGSMGDCSRPARRCRSRPSRSTPWWSARWTPTSATSWERTTHRAPTWSAWCCPP